MIYTGIQGNVKELNQLIAKLPGLMQSSAYEKGLHPAAKVIERRLKELTPKSSETKTTKKWSKATQAKRGGEFPLWKTTATKRWRAKSSGSAYAFVGFKWPTGNKAHFIVISKGETRKRVLWGKRTGQTFRKEYDILNQSMDDSSGKAAAAFTAAVAKDVDKRLSELKRG